MKYKLLIFDMDGTILDTLDDLMISTNYALKYYGLKERSKEEIKSFVGNGIKRLIELAVPLNTDYTTTNIVFEKFKEHYSKHCNDNTKAYTGIIPMLQQLKKDGYMLAILSNKIDSAVKKLANEYFNKIFDYAMGQRDGISKKPSPQAIYKLSEDTNINKNEILYIGDSEVDIETSINAKIDYIIVDWGFRDHDFLEQKGAAKIISKPNELLNCIK